MENIVSQDHGYGIGSNKLFADQKRLGQSVGAGLDRVGKLDPELLSIA